MTTANVFIENGAAKLSAIENFICGVPSFYRPFFVQHSKVNSMELIDVFTFGHVLFEMQSTYSLQEPYIREIPIDCPALISKLIFGDLFSRIKYFFLESLLELIIAKDALKVSSPSIEQVLSHGLFKEFASSFEQLHSESLTSSKLSFELPSKDSVVKASQKTEQRLKDEQKLVN